MARPKKFKEHTYVVVTLRWGTPNHLEIKPEMTPGDARRRARDEILKLEKWAMKFNHALRDQCQRAREEIDNSNLARVRLNGILRWELRDDHTGLTLVIELERTK